MQEFGIEINVPKEEYTQRLTASYSNEQHLAIIISFGGRGLQVERIICCSKENRIPILLISSTEDFEIKKMQIIIYIYVLPKLTIINSRLSLLVYRYCIYLMFYSYAFFKRL